MMSIFITLLVNLLIETSVSFIVVVPGDPVVAHVGSTVILPCWISPPENAEALEIRWYRHNFNNPVLLYNHGKIQDTQEEPYRNRSSLKPWSDQSDGLKDGDISLRLEKLRVQDDGSFRCYVSGESSYGSDEVVLKITALGSAPLLFPKPLDDGRVNISCRSSGWYPEPSVTWTSDDGRVLHPGGSSHSRGADEMFSVHSWTAVSRSDAQLVSCSISLRTGEIKEGRLNIQGIMPSGPWKALFITFLVFGLLGLAGLILYKYRDKLTGKKPGKGVCEEETMEKLIKEETNTEEPKEDAVGDVNIEELRKHAVEITIDPERVHTNVIVTKDCKIVRDSPGYNHTGEGFPYELRAFGAQRFNSGRHYWEVELARENTTPKNYWLIGVMKEGNFRGKSRATLPPSKDFCWFLCSDGPHGFHTNTDPPVKLSLTPRPKRLGVLLDYDDGQLSFYNVKESKHLLTISTSFSGSVVPLFNPGVGDLSPMTILNCPKPVESAVKSSDNPKPVESAIKSSDDPISVESAVKSSDNPNPVESAVKSSDNPKTIESPVKSSDNPKTVESPVKSSDNPKPVESAVKFSDDPKPVESAVKSSDNPKPVESAEKSSDNPKTVESAVKSPVESSDNPKPVESAVKSSDNPTVESDVKSVKCKKNCSSRT